MAELTLLDRIYMVEEGKLPSPEDAEADSNVGIFRLPVKKTGTGSATARISTTGSSNRTAERYKDRGIKSREGDFYASTQELKWEPDEEGIKYIEVEIYRDEIPDEQGEYFYATLSSKNADINLYRSHVFIFDDLAKYLEKYVEMPFSLKGVPQPIKVTPISEGMMDFHLMDVNGQEYPKELMPAQRFEEERINKVIYAQVGDLTWFNFDFHIERITPVDAQAVRFYEQENQTQLSQYSTLYLVAPFKNESDLPVPINISNSQVWNFQRMGREEQDEEVNSSLTGVFLANSNKILLEYARDVWKSNLNILESIDRNGNAWKPSFHIIATGFVPRSKVPANVPGNTKTFAEVVGEIESNLSGVYYMSESDYPWKITTGKSPLADHDILEILGIEGNLKRVQRDYKDFLRSQLNGSYKENYEKLISIIDNNFVDVKAERVWQEGNSVEITLLICAKFSENEYIALLTTSIET